MGISLCGSSGRQTSTASKAASTLAGFGLEQRVREGPQRSCRLTIKGADCLVCAGKGGAALHARQAHIAQLWQGDGRRARLGEAANSIALVRAACGAAALACVLHAGGCACTAPLLAYLGCSSGRQQDLQWGRWAAPRC